MQEKLKDENTLVNCLIHVDVFGEGNKREYNNISIEKNISGGTITVTVIESNKTVFKAESKRGSSINQSLPTVKVRNTYFNVSVYEKGDWEFFVNDVMRTRMQVSEDLEKIYENFKTD